jgi:hypothetical protein
MGNPVGYGVGLPGARAGDDQEGYPWSRVLLPDAMLDGSSLFAIEGLEIGDGHRWQFGLQQVKPINHLSRFVRNSYQVSTLPYAGLQGSSTVVPAEIEGTALTCLEPPTPVYVRIKAPLTIRSVQTFSGRQNTIGEDRTVEISEEDATCLIPVGWTLLTELRCDGSG